MSRRTLPLALVLLAFPPALCAQRDPLQICIVHASGEYGGSSLAKELTSRKLKNGAPIAAVVIVADSAKERTVATKRAGCEYVVTMQIHNAAGPDPDRWDKDWVAYELRKADQSKVLSSGYAPRGATNARGRWTWTPYPAFADRIVAKLNSLF